MSNPALPAQRGIPKFNLGRVVATAAAVEVLSEADIFRALDRHICGDW